MKKTDTDKALAAVREAWEQSPRKPVSLWDMIQVAINRFSMGLNGLEEWRSIAARAAEEHGAGNEATDDLKHSVCANLDQMMPFCEALHLTKTADRIILMRNRLTGLADTQACCNEVVVSEIESLLASFWWELGRANLIFLPEGSVKMFEQAALFGSDVDTAFPSARQDIKDAGNCLALELHTAAIFHLMRVAEIGARVLAHHLKVRIRGGLEFADWGKLSARIEEKLDVLSRKPRGRSRAQDLEFYGGVMLDFNAFKELWRNPVMHTRTAFNEGDAKGAYLHVRSFMQRLAKRVSE